MDSRLTRAFTFCAALAAPSAVSAEVLFRGNFESGNLTGWSTLNPMTAGRMNINVVTMPVFEGMRAAEIVIHPDDLWPGNNHNRVELHYDAQRTAEGNTMFFSWYFRLPANAQTRNDIAYWESAQTYQQAMAFWIEPGGGGTQLSFRTNNPGMTHFTGPVSINAWHQIAMQVLWSANAATGRVNVWLDGQKIVNDVPARTKPDTNAVFIQLGYHRNSTATPVETIYIDNAIEATTLAEVLTMGGMGGAGGSGGVAGGGAGGGAAGATGGAGGTSGAGGAPMSAGAGGQGVAGTGGAAAAGGSAGGTAGAGGAGGSTGGGTAGMTSTGGVVGTGGTPGASGAAGSLGVAGASTAAGTTGAAGSVGASGSGSGGTGSDDGGCAVAVPRPAGGAAWLAAAVLALWVRRRRR